MLRQMKDFVVFKFVSQRFNCLTGRSQCHFAIVIYGGVYPTVAAIKRLLPLHSEVLDCLVSVLQGRQFVHCHAFTPYNYYLRKYTKYYVILRALR